MEALSTSDLHEADEVTLLGLRYVLAWYEAERVSRDAEAARIYHSPITST